MRRICVAGIVVAFLSQVAWAQQSQPAKQIELKNEKILQSHYAAAQKAQAANKLGAAAQQYEIFLADALGELAIAEAHGNEYKKASANFDTALSLAPNSPALLVEYAELALRTGRLAKAEKLSKKIIQKYPKNKNARMRAYSVLGRSLLLQGNSTGAKKNLEQAVSLNPNFLNGYELAVACLDAEDQKCAGRLFAEMKSAYKNKAILHMYFGQAYMDSDFQSKAVGEFKEAIAANNKLPGAHYSLAAAYLANGNHVNKAEAQLQQEIALHPKEALAHAALGHLEAGQRHYADAEKELKAAAALAPNDPDPFLYLGQLYAAKHENKKAIAALRRSIALTKDILRNHNQVQKAHFLLGRLLMQAGDRAAAQKQMQISQKMMNQSLSRARQKLADFYHQGTAGPSGNPDAPQAKTAMMQTKASIQSAQAAASFARHVGPAIANSFNNLGAIAGMRGAQSAAYEDFVQAKRWDPTMPGIDENLGRAAFSSFHFAAAVAPLSDYVNRHPKNVTIRSALGISLYMTKDYAKAKATLKPVIESGKGNSEIAYLYAESQVKTGDIKPGIDELKALAQKLPKEGNLRRALGEAYAAEGNTSEAITELQAAEKLNGKNPQVHLDLAKVYKKAGQAQNSAREMQQYQALAAKAKTTAGKNK